MAAERKTLTQLSVPICLETLFYMLSGMVDTLMLSSVSDQAVGAVGTANTYIGVFIIMFGVISSGMIAVMSQTIGAGRPGIAYQARQLGLIFNALIGIVMSVILATFSGGILRIVSIAPALLEPAEIYLRIVGGTCFLNALIPIFSSYLRVFGYTKHSLIGTVVGNVLNIILNSVFLFAFNWGVMGVAVATVISRVVEMGINVAAGYNNKYLRDAMRLDKISGDIFKNVVKRGIPLLCNEILWSISIALISQCYSTRGLEAVAAINITTTVTNFFMIICYAMGNSISIIVGQRLGAGEIEYAKDYDLKMVFMNFMMCLCIGVALFGCSSFIPQIYNTSIEVKSLATSLLRVSACMLPIISLYYSSYFTMRAGGKTLLTFFFDSGYTFMFTFMVALCLTRFTNLPIFNVYLLVQCVDIPKAVLGITLVKKGIWVHNIVNEL